MERRLSVEDYLNGPDERPMELVKFIAREPPAPLYGHQSVVTRATVLLDGHVRRFALGQVCVSPVDVVLDRNQGLVVQPDVVLVSNQRAGIIQRWIEGAPDLVVEVASRRTAERDRTVKMAWYRRYGVRECWLLDPRDRTVEIFELQPDRTPSGRRFTGDEPVQSSVLPDFREPASAFFE